MSAGPIRLTVITADFDASMHVPGATTQTVARTFDLPPEIAEYIAAELGTYTTVTLAIARATDPKDTPA